MDPISIVAALTTAIPAIIKFMKGDDAADKATALINVAQELTGLKDPKAAVLEVSGSPELIAQFRQRLAELEIEELKAHLADVADARDMQKHALAQDDQFAKRFIYYAAIGILSFTGLFLLLATFVPIPDKNLRIVDTALGFLLGTAAATVIQFFFGSSKQSQHKDNTIADLMKSAKGFFK